MQATLTPGGFRLVDAPGSPTRRGVAILGSSGIFAAESSALAGIDQFDASFFRIAPLDAELMDPQQRLFLELSWRAIEDAGYSPSALRGRSVGVLAGAHHVDYRDILQSRAIRRAQAVTGNALAMMANRVSYFFDFHGPSIVYDAGTASAFTAIAHAFDAIRGGECDYALAGAVHLNLRREAGGRSSADGAGVVLLAAADLPSFANDRRRALLLAAETRFNGAAVGATTCEAFLDEVCRREHLARRSIALTYASESLHEAASGLDIFIRAVDRQSGTGPAAVALTCGTGVESVCIVESLPDTAPPESPRARVLTFSALDSAMMSQVLATARDFFQSAVNLRDAAFTLQTGRHIYPQRLAIIASDTSEARHILEDAAAGRPHRSILTPESAASAVSVGSLAFRLAAEWVGGGDVDWTQLYAGETPRRGPAPSQPLRKHRFWFDSFDALASPEPPPPPAAATPRAGVVGFEVLAGGIALVTLRDLANRNMFSPELVRGIADALERIRGDASLRAVVLTNEGPCFAMGGTSESLSDIAAGKYSYSDLPFLYEGLLSCPVPVIAAMRGGAQGAGLVFGLYADIVVMAEESVYASNFLKLGITPGLGSTFILPHRLGSQLANEIMLTARPFTGAQLRAKGAPLRFAKLDSVLQESIQAARNFASRDRADLEHLKKTLTGDLLTELRKVIPAEAAMQRECFQQSEVRDRIAAHFGSPTQSAEPAHEYSLDPVRVRLANPKQLLPPTPLSLDPPKVRLESAVRQAPARPSLQLDVAARIVSIIAQAIHADPAFIGLHTPFAELGLDSVNGVEVIREINTAFGLSLAAAVLYDHPTLQALASFIELQLSPAAPKETPDEPAPVAPPTPARAASFEPIAIIGVAGRFPGAADHDEFWRNLCAGVNSISEPPPERGWNLDAFYDPNPRAPAASISKWGGFLHGVDQFDAQFFSMSHREAEVTSPEQRLFLMEAWNAFEDAGYSDARLSGTRCGVFVGVNQGDYPRLAGPQYLAHALSGLSPCGLASRISYRLNLRGPSMAIDSACSSSLVALTQACQSLHAGDCEMAIAGGVSLMLAPDMHVLASKAGILSPRGRCAPFDASADGIVLSEAVSAVVLKPLARALQDRDPIWAVIRGAGINQDGQTNGFSAPSAPAQVDLQQRVLARAGVLPEEVTFIEAHGTGTLLGDPIELKALSESYGSTGGPACVVASVKSNVGHANTAAGLTGLVRVLLQFRHRKLAPSLHYENPNPHAPANGRFRINTALEEWHSAGPRLAAINSFGFTGTNAHVILEEPPPEPSRRSPDSARAYLFPLSGKTPEAAEQRLADLKRWLAERPGTALADISYTLGTGRSHFAHRIALVASTWQELLNATPLRGSSAHHSGPSLSPQYDRATLNHWAEQWASGAALDLALLFSENEARRISLPAYPFSLHRFWVESAARAHKSPLLDGPDFSSSLGSGLVLKKELSPLLALVRDHKVRDRAVFPGVGYIEAALEAAAQAGLDCRALTGVKWLHPLTVETGATLSIRLSQRAEAIDFEAHTGAGLHARATLASGPSAPPPAISISEIQRRCTHHLDAESIYRRYDTIGVQYGPFFRTLRQVWGSQTEALGELHSADSNQSGWAIHPGMLDGALQTIAGLIVPAGEERLLLPFSVDSLEVWGVVGSAAWAWIERRSPSQFDVTLTDPAGHPLVRLAGVTLRPFHDSLAGMFHVPDWDGQPAISPVRPQPAEILLIEPPVLSGWTEAIQSLHPGSRVRTILSESGLDQFPSNWKPDAIYHLGALSQAATTLDEAETHGLLSLFRLVKALERRGLRRHPVRLAVATNNVHGFQGCPAQGPWAAALHGFTKSLAREFRQWDVSCVDLDLSATPVSLVDWLRPAIEEPAVEDGMDVIHRGGTRWVRVLRPLDLPDEGKPVFRERGVYLIAGGSGGIGYELSLHLAERYHASLVWLGRRPENERIREQIAEIRRRGGEVLYISADICDPTAVHNAVAYGNSRFGHIHGAVHSVLDLRDCSITNMTERDLMAVVGPKARGVWHLHEALTADLDWLLLFSSGQSFAGSPGQSNYSAACTAEDALGAWLYQAGRRTVIVNWGYWGTVGAVANREVGDRMAAAGIRSIKPSEGISALCRILASGRSQVLAMWADAEVRQRLGLTAATSVSEAVLRRHMRSTRVLNRYAAWVLLRSLSRAGTLPVIARYARLWRALGDILARRGFATHTADSVTLNPAVHSGRIARVLDALPAYSAAIVSRFPALQPHVALLEACAAELPDILIGTRNGVEVLFPRGSLDRVSGVYQGNPLTDYCNHITAETVARIVRDRRAADPCRPVTVVEIGAGTGATSEPVLNALARLGPGVRFVYTDISSRFVEHGVQRFSAHFPFAEFGVLNMEQPASPLVPPGTVDVIFATNALHASRNALSLLQGLRGLLAGGGSIVINESTEPQDFATMTFGLTDAWWAFEDADRRAPHSPLLLRTGWTHVLEEAGFGPAAFNGDPVVSQVSPQQIVLSAATFGSQYPHAPTPVVPSAAGQPAPEGEHDSSDAALYVKKVFSEVLKTPVEAFGTDATFDGFGIDSLVSQEINARFEADLGPVPSVMLFEYSTIRKLAAYLASNYGEQMRKAGVLVSVAAVPHENPPPTVSLAPVPATIREKVYALADADVELLLHSLLERRN